MSFVKIRERSIPQLQTVAEEYEHRESGAKHYHLATQSKENVFLVAFPTLPTCSDGRAHVLEHLVLCGSQKYQVRAPFFSMRKRSMATFMNAMTYPDKTVYPFATIDPRDFFNLLDVYLDAVFFPTLDYLDFRQEGWRLVYEQNKLAYQGVVLNEMKGAFTNPSRTLIQGLERALYENTVYAHTAGGDPLYIPELSHEALVAFHRESYHPSQAVFMTHGTIPASDIQKAIEAQVLTRISGRRERARPGLAADFAAAKQIQLRVPAQDTEVEQYGVHFAWRLGGMTDTLERCRAELVAAALLGGSSAPLTHAMESAGLGRPSGYNGIDSSMREIGFFVGMEGLRYEQMDRAKRLIWDALNEASDKGVTQQRLEMSLRDFEFQQREITGGSRPFGLKRLLEGLPKEMNGGDPFDVWDSAQAFHQLRADIQDPAFIKNKVVDLLLKNNNRVEADVYPDTEYFIKRETLETEKLQRVYNELTLEQEQRIKSENSALQARQSIVSDGKVLPMITPDMVQKKPQSNVAFVRHTRPEGFQHYEFTIASNEVVYVNLAYDLQELSSEDWHLLALYSELLPELGLDGMTYSEAEEWRRAQAPMFRVALDADGNYFNHRSFTLKLLFSVKGMNYSATPMCHMLVRSIQHARFDEKERILFLLSNACQQARQTLAENGHAYAAYWARSHYSMYGHFQHQVNGIPYLQYLDRIQQQCQTEDGFSAFRTQLEHMHQRIISMPVTAITASAEQDVAMLNERLYAEMSRMAARHNTAKNKEIVETSTAQTRQQVFYAKSQINHCYQVWQAPNMASDDAGPLTVAAALIEHGFLHPALRERGGAYGGNASYNCAAQTFTMSSYRDPSLTQTFDVFMQAVDWVISTEHSQEVIDEAIIATVQGMDRPASPFGDALLALKRHDLGLTDEVRQHHRDQILHCTKEDIQRAARRWLKEQSYTRSAFIGIESHCAAAVQSGMAIVELNEALLTGNT